jgi:pilus assembly protein Flp/PilA
MIDKFRMIAIRIQTTFWTEEGQDLIEYALVVALIALGATAGMNTLATAINQAFKNIAGTLSTCTSGGASGCTP